MWDAMAKNKWEWNEKSGWSGGYGGGNWERKERNESNEPDCRTTLKARVRGKQDEEGSSDMNEWKGGGLGSVGRPIFLGEAICLQVFGLIRSGGSIGIG